VDRVLELEDGTRFQVLAPVVRGRKGEFTELLKELSETEPRAKDAKPEVYMDQRPARQLSSSGFPQQLFGPSSAPR